MLTRSQGKKPPLYCTLILFIAVQRHQAKQTQLHELRHSSFVTFGLESDECQHYYITILLAISKLQIDRVGDKVLLSDNYQANLTTAGRC